MRSIGWRVALEGRANVCWGLSSLNPCSAPTPTHSNPKWASQAKRNIALSFLSFFFPKSKYVSYRHHFYSGSERKISAVFSQERSTCTCSRQRTTLQLSIQLDFPWQICSYHSYCQWTKFNFETGRYIFCSSYADKLELECLKVKFAGKGGKAEKGEFGIWVRRVSSESQCFPKTNKKVSQKSDASQNEHKS